MFVFNPCTRDARVDREAATLAAAGHQVRVYAYLEPGLPAREERRGYTILRLDQRHPLQRLVDDRVLRPLKELRRKPPKEPPPALPAVDVDRPAAPLGPSSPPPPPRRLAEQASPEERRHWRYISHINALWARAAAGWEPEVCHAHDLDTLEAAAEASRRCRARLVYDAHELWSEQPFVNSREAVEYWNSLESRLIGQADAVITVNEPLAHELRRLYGVDRVIPIRNCQRLESPDPARRGLLRQRSGGRPVALYQGGLQRERGLEQLLAAARLQDEVVVALRGHGEYAAALRREAGDQVLVLDPLPHDAMVAGAAEADFGVIPYLPTGLNNYLSTPNKLFEYLMAGLPIAGADIPEVRKVIEEERIGLIFDPYSPRDIARALREMARSPALEEMARRSRAAAEERYHWEREGARLVELYRSLG
jgi:glycosyltransferase involved in cell wall biosynthesis